jgi:hypothetical protein
MLKRNILPHFLCPAIVLCIALAFGFARADEPAQLLGDVICPEADLDGDCFVDFTDLAILAAEWLQAGTACPDGFENCDANSANGCETNVASDVNNCGGCDYICPDPPNGTAGCQDGNCIVASCDTGWGNCDGNVPNGCETNIYTNPNHCGSCGHVCNLPNAMEGCSGGNCVITACESGYANCDGNTANGCEVNLNDGGGTCAAATYLGQVCGEETAGTFCLTSQCQAGPSASARGEKWYRITVQKCTSCMSSLHVWARLYPPADYDLYLYGPCGTVLDSSANSGTTTETVDYEWNGDTRDFYIEIRYYSGSSCNNWTLQTWGGCETGP